MVLFKDTTYSPKSPRWWRWAMMGLSALGLSLSVYLSWHALMGGSVIGCGGGSSCDQVLSSRWSMVAGVLPISGLAAGVYLAMFVASFFIGPSSAPADRRLAWGAMLVLVGAVAGSALWFIIVQRWIIGAFCPYCMATHITGLLLAGLVIWQAPKQFDHNSTHGAPNDPVGAMMGSPVTDISPIVPKRVIGGLSAICLPLTGVMLAGIMAAWQFRVTPPSAYHGGASQHPLSAIDPHSAPLVGSADAQYVVNLLFDYKCPHCQLLHSLLDQAVDHYGGKLAFALCPAPLNNQCNPYVPRYVDEFKDSCELAKVSLAVWVAKREAFDAFDRWMFSPQSGERWHPRTLDAATSKAIELVGQAKFEAARTDPWIEKYMQTCVGIYGNTLGADLSGSAVPKLVYGGRWVTPKPNDDNDLISILQTSLAVPQPDPTTAGRK